jgi:5'-3' exonuclease
MIKRVCVVDGNPLLYRCDSVSDLTTPDGRRVSGVYGALDILQSAVESLAPTHLMVVWDWKRSETWRRYMYPGYKLHRERESSDAEERAKAQLKKKLFFEQLVLIRSLLKMFPVRQFLHYGMEGDDLAYWITHRMYRDEPKNEYICLTVDRDWLQLCKTGVKVFFSDSQVLADQHNFREHSKGCKNIEQFLTMKSIVGDAGDGVKGIPGVGPKLFEDYKSVCVDLDDFAEMSEKVARGLPEARFSRMLVDLSFYPYTPALDKHLHKSSLPKPDLALARKTFQELRFTKFLSVWKAWIRVFKGLQI